MEVELARLELTGADGRADGQAGRWAGGQTTQVSIGMHAHPKMQKV